MDKNKSLIFGRVAIAAIFILLVACSVALVTFGIRGVRLELKQQTTDNSDTLQSHAALKETPDYGGKLLKDHSFYEAYEGKTAEDYDSVPNASGATLTSKGYKDALKKAFAVFEILTEGGNG